MEQTANYTTDDRTQNTRKTGVKWWYIGGIAIVAGTG
jgi:hypothetical protein